MMTGKFKHNNGALTVHPIFTAEIGGETYNVYYTDYKMDTCIIYRVTDHFPEFISVEPGYAAPATLKGLTAILEYRGLA